MNQTDRVMLPIVGQLVAPSAHAEDAAPRREGRDSAGRDLSPEEIGPIGRLEGAHADRLQRVLKKHHGLVWRSLRRFGVPTASVEDATQQVFLTFASRLTEVWPHKERPFLLATALRVASNARRALARSREVPSDAADSTPGAEPDPEEMLEWKERRRRLDQVLDALPFEQRSVFVLFELEGFSMLEIAESFAIPLGTVASRLRRARRRFQALTNARPRRGGKA